MFSTRIFQQGHHLAPSLTVFSDVGEDSQIFGWGPGSFLFIGIQVVEPAFSAMFRGFEYFIVGMKKYVFGYLVPFSSLFLLHSLCQKLIFLGGPSDLILRFDHIQKLKFKKLRLFVEKYGGESGPEGLFLNKGWIVRVLSDLFRESMYKI